jgi:hypothetical protein
MNEKLWRILFVVGLGGFAGFILTLMLAPRIALAAYLAAAVTVVALPLGALVLLMTTYLVPGHWVETMHRPFCAAALTMPLAGVLFIPVLLGMPWIYPWAQSGEGLHAFKAVYLSPALFALRTVAYFAIWTALALWARGAWGDALRMRRMGSVGLIVWSLTVSFAGIDWLETLDVHFHSSIYGLLTIGFVLLAGAAFLTGTVAMIGVPRRRLAGYGAFLLANILLWAYLHAMQFIVIWSGDIPEEVTWYLRRWDSGGWIATTILFTAQFIAPFFALLSERVRSSVAPLLILSALTLLMRAVEAEWLVLPDIPVVSAWSLLAVPASLLFAAAAWILGFRFLLLRALDPRALAASGAAATGSSAR